MKAIHHLIVTHNRPIHTTQGMWGRKAVTTCLIAINCVVYLEIFSDPLRREIEKNGKKQDRAGTSISFCVGVNVLMGSK